MVLSSFGIQNAKPKGKAYTLADGNGLHLLVKPTGIKLWRFRYRLSSPGLSSTIRSARPPHLRPEPAAIRQVTAIAQLILTQFKI